MSTPCSPMVSWMNLSFRRRNSILRGELSSFTLLLSSLSDLSFLLDLRNQFLVAQHPFIRWRPFPLSMERTAQVEIRELNRELLSDYLKFFDRAFSDFPHWAGCYCGFYDTPGDNWDATAESGPEHRAARTERISNGRAQGLLAYIDDEPVGW